MIGTYGLASVRSFDRLFVLSELISKSVHRDFHRVRESAKNNHVVRTAWFMYWWLHSSAYYWNTYRLESGKNKGIAYAESSGPTQLWIQKKFCIQKKLCITIKNVNWQRRNYRKQCRRSPRRWSSFNTGKLTKSFCREFGKCDAPVLFWERTLSSLKCCIDLVHKITYLNCASRYAGWASQHTSDQFQEQMKPSQPIGKHEKGFC